METNSILFFSNQAAIFNHPKDYNTKCHIGVEEFKYLPEWVLESTMFKLLKKENKIRVAGSKKDQIEMEMNGLQTQTENIEPPTSAELDNKLTSYAGMKKRELYDLCVEKGLEPEDQRSKDYYVGLLSQNDVEAEISNN